MENHINMAIIPPPKKRCWGRSNREKINIIENMELEIPDVKVNNTSSDDPVKTNTGTPSIDLQHPELMSNSQLVNLLAERRVPLPVYEDGSYSRERLLFLFRKHILPRPQRKKLLKNQRYKSDIYFTNDGQESMEWANTVQHKDVEVTRCLTNEKEAGNGSVLGKRYTVYLYNLPAELHVHAH